MVKNPVRDEQIDSALYPTIDSLLPHRSSNALPDICDAVARGDTELNNSFNIGDVHSHAQRHCRHNDTAVCVDVGEVLEDDFLVGWPDICIESSDHFAGKTLLEPAFAAEVPQECVPNTQACRLTVQINDGLGNLAYSSSTAVIQQKMQSAVGVEGTTEERLHHNGYLVSIDRGADNLGVGVETGVLEDVDLVVSIEGRRTPKPRH